MEKQPIEIVQVIPTSDHVYALDKAGQLWYRKKLPYSYNTSTYITKDKADKEELDAAKLPWRRVSMMGVVEGDDIPASRQVPPEVVGPPIQARPETAIPVQQTIVSDNGIEIDIDLDERNALSSPFHFYE